MISSNINFFTNPLLPCVTYSIHSFTYVLIGWRRPTLLFYISGLAFIPIPEAGLGIYIRRMGGVVE